MTEPQTSAPTQKFVEIQEIRNGVIYLKKGGLRRVLIVSGVNFDLKSEDEQTLILNSFQNFLNTLDFSVQFFIHSRKVNVDNYLEKMEERKNQETNELLKIQIEEYINFIKSFVEQNAIINKSFFVVIPYEPVALTKKTTDLLMDMFRPRGGTAKKEGDREENIEQLTHRVDQVVAGLEQIGLRAALLEDEELVELYYNLYNPQLVEKRGVEIANQKPKTKKTGL